MIIFDTENGRDPKAAAEFVRAITFILDEPGHDITITIGDISLKAYDHAALVGGLIEAIETYRLEIS